MSTSTPHLLIAAIGAVLLTAGTVVGQNALGAGDALDNNLNATEGRFNTAVPRVDYAARNLIVTNNVAGGRGFRDAVGYTAARDFRGLVADDSQYGFRRDSAYSAPSLASYGLAYAGMPLQNAGYTTAYWRSAAGATPRWLSPTGQIQRNQVYEMRQRIDLATQAASMRDSLSLEGEPATIGFGVQDGSLMLVRASGLRGLTLERPESNVQAIGLTTWDKVRLQRDRQLGIESDVPGTEYRADMSSLLGSGARQDTMRTDPALTGDVQNIDSRRTGGDYLKVLERVVKRYADQHNIDFDLEDELLGRVESDVQRLRELMATGLADVEEPTGRGASRILPGGDFDPARLDREEDPDAMATGDGDETGEPGEDEIDISQITAALRHGERLETLRTTDEGRFQELVRSGEDQLKAGEYFRAERQFARALRFKPGEPLATAGLAHSQLGAGTYLSAALTLRSLFSHQPAMIDVAYQGSLLPNSIRLDRAVATLRDRMYEQGDKELYAFLLAYVGHQRDDREMIEEGLTALRQAADDDDPLVPVLFEIWLPSLDGETDDGN